MTTRRLVLLAAAAFLGTLALAWALRPRTSPPEPEPATSRPSYGLEFPGPAPPGPWLVVETGLCCHKFGIPGLPDPEYYARCAPAAEVHQAAPGRSPEHTRTVPITEQQADTLDPGAPCPDETAPAPSTTTKASNS